MLSGNETAVKLRQAIPCGFTQIMLYANGQSDGKIDVAFKKATDKIIAGTGFGKVAAVPVVRLAALSPGWSLKNYDAQ